jgi:uncharacterized protein YcgI (DUF1989 family)
MARSTPETTVEVPGYSGRAVAVKQGQLIRVTDVEGQQIGDLFAISAADHFEFLSAAVTRAVVWKLFPDVGEAFYTTLRRPILTFLEDNSPGIHDMLFAPCDRVLFEMLGCTEYHRNCRDNYLEAAAGGGRPPTPGAAPRGAGIRHTVVPDPVNIFENTPPRTDGRLYAGAMPTKAGDNMLFRAEMDLIFVLTACSCDIGMNDINGGKSTPLRIEVLPG